jgi:CBS domain containing-hemolysin-like protein
MIIVIAELSVVLILLSFSFIFSGSEVALLSMSDVERLKLQQSKKKKIKLLLSYINQPQKALITILIGNVVVNLSASILGEQLSNEVFAYNSLFYSIFIMTFFILLLGEIVPKNIAASSPLSFAKRIIRVVDVSNKIFHPLVLFISKLISKESKHDKDLNLSKDEIFSAIDKSSEAGLDTVSIDILKNLIGLIDRPVTDLMIPRADIQAVDLSGEWTQIKAFIANYPYSSIIFFHDNIDNIVGYVNKMDLIKIKKKHLFTVLQEPLFIPEPKTIVSVLSEFKIRNIYIAIILDEYGGTSGLITLKDILDYIFIKDILIKNLIQKKDKSVWTVSGETKIFEINMYFNIDLPVDSNTISGYIVNKSGEIPKEGESLSLAPGIHAKILKSDEKQIDLLEINRVEK